MTNSPIYLGEKELAPKRNNSIACEETKCISLWASFLANNFQKKKKYAFKNTFFNIIHQAQDFSYIFFLIRLEMHKISVTIHRTSRCQMPSQVRN